MKVLISPAQIQTGTDRREAEPFRDIRVELNLLTAASELATEFNGVASPEEDKVFLLLPDDIEMLQFNASCIEQGVTYQVQR